MANRALSRRVVRLIAAAQTASTTLNHIKHTLDAYLMDGIAPERTVAAIALALTHRDLSELDSAISAFSDAV